MAGIVDHSTQPRAYNLQKYIDCVGIAAILWPFRRFIEGEQEKRLSKGVDEWMNYFIRRKDWVAISEKRQVNGIKINVRQAALVYRLTYLADFNAMLRVHKTLYRVLEKFDYNSLQHFVLDAKRCSVMKAALRLSKLENPSVIGN